MIFQSSDAMEFLVREWCQNPDVHSLHNLFDLYLKNVANAIDQSFIQLLPPRCLHSGIVHVK